MRGSRSGRVTSSSSGSGGRSAADERRRRRPLPPTHAPPRKRKARRVPPAEREPRAGLRRRPRRRSGSPSAGSRARARARSTGNQAMIARPLAALTLAPSAPTPTSAAVTAAKPSVVAATTSSAAAPVRPDRDHPALVDAVGDEPPRQQREEHPDPDRAEHDAGLAERQPVVRLQRRARAPAARPRRGEARLRERPRARGSPTDSAPDVRRHGSERARSARVGARAPMTFGQSVSFQDVQRAAAELLRLADLVRVRAVVLRAGGLEHRGQPLQPRVARGRRRASRRARPRGCSRAGRGSSRAARRRR